MLETLTYREMSEMPASIRACYLARLGDDDYRLLMAMIVYHRRRPLSFVDDRTIAGLILEGRIRRTRVRDLTELHHAGAGDASGVEALTHDA